MEMDSLYLSVIMTRKDWITDEERGEIICSPCGQVLTEGITRSDSRPTHSLDGFLRNSQTGPKSSLTVL